MPSVTLHNWDSMPKEKVTDVIDAATFDQSLVGDYVSCVPVLDEKYDIRNLIE